MTSFSPNPYQLVLVDGFSDILRITISSTERVHMDEDLDDYEFQQRLAEHGEEYGW